MLKHGLPVRGSRRRPAIAAVATAILGAALTGSTPSYSHDFQTAGMVARVEPSKCVGIEAAFPPDSHRPEAVARPSRLSRRLRGVPAQPRSHARKWAEKQRRDEIRRPPQKIVLPPAYAHVLRGMLHTEDENSVVARMNLRALLRVPLPVIARLKGAGVLIFISARPVPENADLGWMRGVRARGHGDETWDQIEGTYVPNKKYVVAGGVPGMDAWSGSSLPHELGHAIAHSLGYLDSRELIEAHKRVFGHLQEYEQQGGPGGEGGRDEMYAETVGRLIAGFRGEAIKRTDKRFVRWLEASLGLGRIAVQH